MFAGYKTYITAGVAIITAVAGYATGDASAMDTAQLIFTALIGAFVRHGVGNGPKLY